MRKFVVAAAISAASAATPADMWKKYKEDYGIAFNGQGEDDKRFAIFQSNLEIIEKTNAEKLGFELGINQFTHLTADEFAAQHTGLKKRKPPRVWGNLPYLGRHNYTGATLADSVDWTQKGAVTPVKDQGQCGSCWSFSTTGSLEGAWQIATGNLVSFSEQQFVDCDTAVDEGCHGGLMDNAFKFAEENAICTEDSYPYTAVGGKCKASTCKVGLPKGQVTGFKDVHKDDEKAVMEALAMNPVSVAIEADQTAFQLYKSGILSKKCGSTLDHGVLAVGYGTDGGKDYWKVKNSWGATWGEHGYIRLERGDAGTAGECGILSGPPSYPVVSGKPVGHADPNGFECDICKEAVGKAIDAGVSECKSLCLKAPDSFQSICQRACDMVNTECSSSDGCASKVCGLVKLCSSDAVVV